MKRTMVASAFLGLSLLLSVQTEAQKAKTTVVKANAGLQLPEGFTATIVADNLGRARHLAITPQNDIYVRLARPANGKGTVVLHETDGKATVTGGFGNYGGTGIFIKDGYLYASSNEEIFRYKLDAQNHVVDPANAEKIVTGLIDRGQHETKSLVLDNEGNVYVNIGAYSNSCQEQDRQRGSLGRKPCNILDSAGGIWMFRADKLNQSYGDGVRYATGLRNVVGLDWNQQLNQLFVMQHGRDQLHDIFPDMYTVQQSAELPSECMYALKKGDNAGWPYLYYDHLQGKKMLAPEYGGDGKQEASNEYIDPAAAFPGHMGPNGLLFYTGNQFPERYKNGAFIAFHGSWNRSPEPQAGYFVVFQPMENGKASGKWEVFADNFSGSPEQTASGRAEHRPCGLAQGPDGSLYVSDDVKGTIYKISYGKVAGAPKVEIKKAPVNVAAKGVANEKAPPSKPKTSGATGNTANTKTNATAKAPAAMASIKGSVSAGKAIYSQYCVSCHQPDGGGVQNMNPPLSRTSYVLGNKSRLASIVLKGMSRQPVNGEVYTNVMPPFNYLSDKQVADVLTYVRNSFKNKASAVTAAEVKAARGKK